MTTAPPRSRTRRSRSKEAKEAESAPRVELPLYAVADRVAEAATLVAVVSIPIYFTVLTPTGFEPDKAVLLRVLAVVAGVAWLAGFAARPIRLSTRAPALLWAGVALFMAYLVGTILSIDPGLSLWGSNGRQEGLWSWAAYLVFFVVAATRLRSRQQVERLITVLLVGSIPVVLYGYAQQLGFDPVPNSGDPNTLAWPVRSTLGQHIFLGSYLVMVIPFTLARFLQTRRNWTSTSGSTPLSTLTLVAAALALIPVSFFAYIAAGIYHPALFALFPALLAIYTAFGVYVFRRAGSLSGGVVTIGYAVLLGLQLTTLASTGARAAWLATFAGLVVFALLVALSLRQPRLWSTIIAVSAVAALFLLLLNIPGGPLQPLRTVHGLSRLANITDSGGADGSAQGRILIWQGVGSLMVHTPGIGGTWGGPLRALVGYGPESMHWAFQAVFPLQLRVATSEIWTWDRAHNIYLDRLVDAGIFGLGAFLILLFLFFRRVLKLLPRLESPTSWIFIALGASVAGHLLDGLFAIETAVTLLLLFLIFGLAAGAPWEDEPVEAANKVDRSWLWVIPIFLAAAAVAFVPGAELHPSLLSAVWAISAVVGVVAVVLLLPGQPLSWRAIQVGRPVVAVAMILAGVVALGSQVQYEQAAMASRDSGTLLALQAPSAALGFTQQAARADPHEAQYQTNLGGDYLSLASTRSDSGDPTYVPGPGAAWTVNPSLADRLGRDQLFQLSLQALQKARNLSPLNPDNYDNLGNLYLEWNRPSLAFAAYHTAEALSYENPRYIDEEALALLQEGKADQAGALTARALNLDRTFWFSYYASAMVDSRTGNHAAAAHQASLALYWVRNYWPPPPTSELSQLRSLTSSSGTGQ